ncbi:hypothetical protein [Pinirhizobacter soli]|uniref:hypothetical protein n=1 Tax=Pinirhizobacter soli TaxID=2786953 RepID=UPI00202A55BB|nr:hypothetical protein [Pinirhizobacter soli]
MRGPCHHRHHGGPGKTASGAFGNSSDWGIHALGANTGDNSINYQLSVVNGRGYKNLTRSNNVDTEGRFGYSPIENMVIAVGGYQGKRGNDVENGAPTRDATRGDAMIARYDKLDYKYYTVANLQRKLNDKYYNAGVSYDVLKNLRLALAYKHNQLDGPVDAYTYKTNEIGFWGMLSF